MDVRSNSNLSRSKMTKSTIFRYFDPGVAKPCSRWSNQVLFWSLAPKKYKSDRVRSNSKMSRQKTSKSTFFRCYDPGVAKPHSRWSTWVSIRSILSKEHNSGQVGPLGLKIKQFLRVEMTIFSVFERNLAVFAHFRLRYSFDSDFD